MCMSVSMRNKETGEASPGRRAAVTVCSGPNHQTEGNTGPAGKWIGPWLSGEQGRQQLKGLYSINITLKIYFSTFEVAEHIDGRVGTNEEAHLFEPVQATNVSLSSEDGLWFSTFIF